VSPGRLHCAIGASAFVVYVGALWNRFALDDLIIIGQDPLVHSVSGVWRAFTHAYMRGEMYRPLTIASYTLDWSLQSFVWYHAVNVLWHVAASVLVAVLAGRWVGRTGALVAGLVFAVHPVHVEAVANVVGRDELMAALFALLAVYAALGRGGGSVWWSAAALGLGLLCKESAAVVPGLVVWGWVVGLGRPPRRRMVAFGVSWVVLALAYGTLRWRVLHGFDVRVLAPVFAGLGPIPQRLTALAALADVARLLVFPLTLRVDYSPLERTAVTAFRDPRLWLGLVCLVAWGVLLRVAWRRGQRVEAFGLGWIAIAYSPVANLLFPTGILVAERTLYLPSVGLALAVGAWLERVLGRRLWPVVAAVLVAAGLRTALRVPVWQTDYTAILSILQDSPRSYDGPTRMADVYLQHDRPAEAVEAAQAAIALYDLDPRPMFVGAAAAHKLGRDALADSLLASMRRLCPCYSYFHLEAQAATARGDTALARWLLTRMPPASP
jgi:protein O-mannosyl-transferase